MKIGLRGLDELSIAFARCSARGRLAMLHINSGSKAFGRCPCSFVIASASRLSLETASKRFGGPFAAGRPLATGLNGLENFQTVSFSGVTSKTMPTAPELINVFPLGRRWAPEMNHE